MTGTTLPRGARASAEGGKAPPPSQGRRGEGRKEERVKGWGSGEGDGGRAGDRSGADEEAESRSRRSGSWRR